MPGPYISENECNADLVQMRAWLLETFHKFCRDQRGNIAVIFVIACVPLISAVGCAVDYSRAVQLRTKLLAAADAASVGSIAKTSPAFIAAGSMTSDGPIPVGVTDATNIFNGNMSGVTYASDEHRLA